MSTRLLRRPGTLLRPMIRGVFWAQTGMSGNRGGNVVAVASHPGYPQAAERSGYSVRQHGTLTADSLR